MIVALVAVLGLALSPESAAERQKKVAFYHAVTHLDESLLPRGTLPWIVLVGVESAGKTTFLEILAGLPLGYSKTGTATRCPVRYVIKGGENLRVKFAGEEINPQDVSRRVRLHMENIEKGAKFTDDVLEIEVTKPWRKDGTDAMLIFDLVVMDLPGLRAASAPGATEIRTMVAKFARDPATRIVAILKCSENPGTLMDEDTIEQVLAGDVPESTHPPRMDWKDHTVFVVNQLNKYADKWDHVTEAVHFFKTAQQSPHKKMFVNFRPHTSQSQYDREKASYTESVAFLKNFTYHEARWYAELMQRLCANGTSTNEKYESFCTSGNNEHFGTAHVLSALDTLWQKMYNDHMPDVFAKLKGKWRTAKQDVKECETLLLANEKKAIRQEFEHFTLDFAEHSKGILLQSNVRKHLKTPSKHLYGAGTHGRTFAEDIALQSDNAHNWEFFIGVEDLLKPEHLGGERQILGRDMKLKKIGIQAFRRLMDYFTYCVLVKPFEHFDDDTIESFANALGNTNQFESFQFIVQMVLSEVYKASDGTTWLFDTIHLLFTSYTEKVLSHLRNIGVYPRVANATHFLHKLTEAYEMQVQRLLNGVKARWDDDLEIFSEYIDEGAPVKNLLGSLLFNVELIIGKPEELYSPAVPFSPTDDTSDEEGPGGQLAPGLRLQRDELKPHAKNKLKLQHVEEIRKYLTGKSKHFNVADLLEQNLISIKPQLRSIGIDHAYLKGVAREYYFVHMNRLLDCLSAALNAKLIKPLTADPTRQIELGLLDVVSSYSDDELENMVAPDREQIQERFASAKKAVQDLDDVLKLSSGTR